MIFAESVPVVFPGKFGFMGSAGNEKDPPVRFASGWFVK